MAAISDNSLVKRPPQALGPIARSTHAVLAAGAPVVNGVRDLFAPMRIGGVGAKPSSVRPADLTVVSYNLCNEAWKPALIERDLLALRPAPDVICLQETNLEITQQLAKRLGMYYAFYGQRSPLKGSLKAVLSRYPIEQAQDKPFTGMVRDRLLGYWNHLRQTHNPFGFGETLESRSVLLATLNVGGRKVDVLDTHLTLGDSRENAKELRQLTALAKAREALGHTVVVGGDFNANMTLALPGTPEPRGTLSTPSDTAAKFRDRYGEGAGNMGDARDQMAGQALFTELQGYWTAPNRTVIQDGHAITPEAAIKLLNSDTIEVGTPRYKQLMMALDGVSHLGARKRFDNLLVSKDVTVTSASIDQDAKGSDHSPVSAQFRFK
jgi:endonuclease/exonuclease/phosphatase family metal-dependent hydrolase